MTQQERRLFLLDYLRKENPVFGDIEIPEEADAQKDLLRAIFNVRYADPFPSEEFLKVQDDYLQEELKEKGVQDVEALSPLYEGYYLWKGDITTLKVDGIVNAANSGMTGCYRPNHKCIDNAIHTYAGVQLRHYCSSLMKKQGFEEPRGQVKVTPAYNLPSKFILHTVGPVVQNKVTEEDRKMLASCYRSCLAAAEAQKMASIAFCCISTGVFSFPKEEACRIALRTVVDYFNGEAPSLKVVFCVYADEDEAVYRKVMAELLA